MKNNVTAHGIVQRTASKMTSRSPAETLRDVAERVQCICLRIAADCEEVHMSHAALVQELLDSAQNIACRGNTAVEWTAYVQHVEKAMQARFRFLLTGSSRVIEPAADDESPGVREGRSLIKPRTKTGGCKKPSHQRFEDRMARMRKRFRMPDVA